MKKIDKFLIASFIPPFVVTFFVAIFVLMMQFLWLYIDDIIGKGVGIGVLLQLIGYLSISLFPLALPIATLISSVMVMGNLAEHYELSSLKSAGVPLLRIMAPLMFCGLIISGFSYVCSNYLVPIANLKYKSKLYDIRKAKPALSIEAGIFNDDFQNIIIYVGDKDNQTNMLKDLKIYDHRNDKGKYVATFSDYGELSNSASANYLILDLKDGYQYQEGVSKKKDSYPFIRTKFKSWKKVFDLSEFNLKLTDEDLFKSHRSMISHDLLLESIDSLHNKFVDKENQLHGQMLKNFQYYKEEGNDLLLSVQKKKEVAQNENEFVDTLVNSSKEIRKAQTAVHKRRAEQAKSSSKPIGQAKVFELKQVIDRPLSEYNGILETFEDHKQWSLVSRTRTSTRRLESQFTNGLKALFTIGVQRAKHIYEYHNRFSMALICLVFLFIGAPMGAIVRKGGFGYPILIAIIYFMVYVILRITFENMAEEIVLPGWLAAWLPAFILFPIGVFLTIKAMNDSKVLDFDKYIAFFKRLFPKKENAEA